MSEKALRNLKTIETKLTNQMSCFHQEWTREGKKQKIIP